MQNGCWMNGGAVCQWFEHCWVLSSDGDKIRPFFPTALERSQDGEVAAFSGAAGENQFAVISKVEECYKFS